MRIVGLWETGKSRRQPRPLLGLPSGEMNPSVEVEVEAMLEVGAATETGRYCKVRIPSALVFARCGRAAIGSDTLLVGPSLPMRTRSACRTLGPCHAGLLRVLVFASWSFRLVLPLLNPRSTNSFVSLTRSHVHP